MKPHLLIDIDGVLNPFGLDFDPDGFVMHEIPLTPSNHIFKVFLSEANHERFKILSEHFNPVWATMWEHEANDHIDKLLGHDEPLEVIEFSGSIGDHRVDEYWAIRRLRGTSLPRGMTTYKLPYVHYWAKNNEPFAWIDDDLGNDVFKWAEEREVPTLPIRIPDHTGLTDEHVEQLIEFANSCKEQDDSSES